MKKINIAAIILFALALVMTGCAGSSGSSGSNDNKTKIIEPEQLISKEDAQQITGLTLDDGKKTENPVVGQKIMYYAPVNDTSSGLSYFQISISQQAFMPKDSQNTPQSIYETTKAAFSDADKAEGVGDEAMYFVPGLHILSDGYYIVLAAGNSDDETVRQALKQAGILAVENLQKIIGQ